MYMETTNRNWEAIESSISKSSWVYFDVVMNKRVIFSYFKSSEWQLKNDNGLYEND